MYYKWCNQLMADGFIHNLLSHKLQLKRRVTSEVLPAILKHGGFYHRKNEKCTVQSRRLHLVCNRPEIKT